MQGARRASARALKMALDSISGLPPGDVPGTLGDPSTPDRGSSPQTPQRELQLR